MRRGDRSVGLIGMARRAVVKLATPRRTGFGVAGNPIGKVLVAAMARTTVIILPGALTGGEDLTGGGPTTEIMTTEGGMRADIAIIDLVRI